MEDLLVVRNKIMSNNCYVTVMNLLFTIQKLQHGNNAISRSKYVILCYKILRNVLQFYVTGGNEQHMPRLALYRKMEMTVVRQTDDISYSSFIRR